MQDLARPEFFLNRELTWLNFNYRVLHEGEDARTPLLERVKFLAIVSSNLDEFFMKRIGGLKQQVGAGILDATVDGRSPQQQITECHEVIRDLELRKRHAFLQVILELRRHDVVLAAPAELKPRERKFLRQYYLQNIHPLVTPQATDPAHPFPFISNLSLNLLVTLRYRDDPTQNLARVKVPLGTGIPRFVRLEDRDTFVPLEEVMADNLDLLFPGMEVDNVSCFRVTRNANTEHEEERAEDLLAMIEDELRDRKFAPIVRLEVARTMPAAHRGMLAAELGLDENTDVFEVDGLLGMSSIMELATLPRQALRDPPHHPVDHHELASERNIFHVIRDAGALLLHHPYLSFPNSVERFLRDASLDPQVRAIKMALYRTSADTKVINYLIDAARNGKQVAVVVELKARFDEEANIRWASRMEEVGIHVTYGVLGLKTHCKVILVVRQDYNGLKRYAHVGTGNYHAGTARLYSDLGLLTCLPAIGEDLTELFNYLTTGYKPNRGYQQILTSPKTAKSALLQRIEREISHSLARRPGLIQFKMNAIEDPEICRALYRAAHAGVRVDLIVRDTCRLRPGLPGLSESMRVISIVGRFLEHSRVFYFRNDGEEEYYIGSADCMSRNLHNRVEVLVPVHEPQLRADLRVFLDAQLSDRRSAWEMQPDGSYAQLQPQKGKEGRSSQQVMIDFYEQRAREATRLKKRKPKPVLPARPASHRG